ncbi:nitrogenase-stabilizing/protective protein NifW [Halorhodospira halochloris]|uniref:nitrogenase-stabilizing/protective protein NifW n=1 Tax=Halorhodospira halochloris TaxID=1052 RepID=UPI001EE8DEB2|nr:nitrogenase-stabilizing/protective protein NifW [Halorhodospira halochloris]MCG5548821.1 nitrogenase-stabilizing/protective protein NifW [Halorhodospira halochloris]
MSWQVVLERALAALEDNAGTVQGTQGGPDDHDDGIDDIAELSAEAFFEALGVEYRADLVRVYRLHILQRFHDYLRNQQVPADQQEALKLAGAMLSQAHDDFLNSDPRTEAVLRVYQQQTIDPHTTTIPISAIRRGRGHAKTAL